MKHIKYFENLESNIIDIIDDYMLPLSDINIKLKKYEKIRDYININSYNLIYELSEKIEINDETDRTIIVKMYSDKMHDIKQILFTISKRIIKNCIGFRYRTSISLNYTKEYHVEGYIENNSSFIGYHSQKGLLIPKTHYNNPSAISVVFKDFFTKRENLLNIIVEIDVIGFDIDK